MDSDYEGYEEYRDDLEAWETEQVFRDGYAEWRDEIEADVLDGRDETMMIEGEW
jgi:hypothetical protein